MPESAAVECPACDTALAPEPIAPGVWLCPCCASLFRAPAGDAALASAPARVERPACCFVRVQNPEGAE